MKALKSILYQLLNGIRRMMWSFIVAYMLGIHNFYYGDTKSPDDSIITVEVKEDQTSGTPKD